MANISDVFNIDFTLESKDEKKQTAFQKIIEDIKNGNQSYYNLINENNCADGRWSYENNLDGYFSLSWEDDNLKRLYDLLDEGDEILVSYDETECGNCFAGHGFARIKKDKHQFTLSHDYETVNWDWRSIYEEFGTDPDYAVGFFDNVYGKRYKDNGETIDEFIEDHDDYLTHYRYEDGHCDYEDVKEMDKIIYYRMNFKGCEGELHGY